VRLRHSSWTYEGAAIASYDILHEDDLQFLWLPMAHSFGKVLLSTQLACGFATAIDGRVDKIVDNLGVVKPTFMGAAPRIFEKAHGRIITMQQAEGGLKEKIFTQAFAVGRKVVDLRAAGRPVPLPLKLQYGLFDKLVFSKVRARFGGRVRFFISGSAALNRDIAKWFDAAGVLILEGYGLTETAAGAFVNAPDDNRIGTVGPPIPGARVRIADDGEILVKGGNVCLGYFNDPKATAVLIDEEGWMHSGDVGCIDSAGYLTVTGRKKDLIITAHGQNIAPQEIETDLRHHYLISEAVVIGEGRRYLTAVLTLDGDALVSWAEAHHKIADTESLAVDPDLRAEIDRFIDAVNEQRSRVEHVRKYHILAHDFTVAAGEMTPTLKVKRNVVNVTYRDVIDEMYAEG